MEKVIEENSRRWNEMVKEIKLKDSLTNRIDKKTEGDKGTVRFSKRFE